MEMDVAQLDDAGMAGLAQHAIEGRLVFQLPRRPRIETELERHREGARPGVNACLPHLAEAAHAEQLVQDEQMHADDLHAWLEARDARRQEADQALRSV